MADANRYGPPESEVELAQLAGLVADTFAGDVQRYGQWLQRLGPQSLRVLRSGERIVAGLVIYDLGQFYGGKRVPAWGVGCVAVSAECRGAGAGSELMTALLGEMFQRGVALSPLYPATQPVYRRLGWEIGGARIVYQVDVRRLPTRQAGPGLRAITEQDHPLLQQIYTARAQRSAGHLDRNRVIWERVFHSVGGSKLFGYVVEDRTGPVGYILYEQQRTDPASITFRVVVRDLVFATGAAGRRLLALLAQHRSVVEQARICAAPDGPLPCLCDEQVLEPCERFDWMVRIVHVPIALEQRGWPAGLSAKLALQIVDDALPQNSGCYGLDVKDGTCAVQKVSAAELRVDIRGLAALFTGRLSPAELRQAGYLEGPEQQDGLLQAAFAGPQPWTPDFF